MTLGDEVVVMNDGEIQQVDSPQRLYDYPANRFVAEFIGDPAMNTLGVTVERDEGYRAVHSGFQLPLPAADSLENVVGSRAVLGVRPEDLSLADAGAADAFEATVTVTEPLGDSLLLECRVGDETVRVQASPRSDAEPGDSVALTHDPERLHLFDCETGGAVYHSATAAGAGTAEGRVRTPADGGRPSADGE